MQPFRREIQMIFQDPYGSLNPRRRVGSIIGDPFAIHKTATGDERKRAVQELMERVGLNPEHYNRFPAEFSGGQRQRIGVARALALRPKLIICDEPVSALDVSIQAQVLNLLADLQRDFGLTYLFIAHDLEVVRHVSDAVTVMYLGRVAEVGYRGTRSTTRPAPVHRGAAVGGARRRPGRGRGPAADHPDRRRAIADQPARPAAGSIRGARRRRSCAAPHEPVTRGQGGRPGTHLTACHFPVEDGRELAPGPAEGAHERYRDSSSRRRPSESARPRRSRAAASGS